MSQEDLAINNKTETIQQLNSAVVSAAPLIDLVELGMPFVAAGTFETINVDLFDLKNDICCAILVVYRIGGDSDEKSS